MGPRDEVLLLSFTRDGRLASPRPFEAFRERLGAATDCFVFCHGWLNDQTEARDGALRFFAHLDTALQPLRDRVVPLRLAIHWPSRPFADPTPARLAGQPEAMPAPLGRLGELARRQPGALASVIALLCEAEVALSPEDELELDALVRQVGDAARGGGLSAAPLQALSFWLMKRRAGQVGERLGREWLAPAFTGLGDRAPRVHLIGHSFGAKLVTSAVLAGVRPDTLVLLQAAFSAFAFAEDVPGTKRPGFYRPVIAERMVARSIVALRSDHDRALGTLYPAVTWGHQVDRTARNLGRRTRVREVVARSAMGAVGVLGVGALEIDLVTAQKTGVPRGVITVDGSRVVTRREWLIGAHRDIYHDEIARLVLLAAGLLTGGPAGPRPRPVSPLHTA